jgi:hypothetical protein
MFLLAREEKQKNKIFFYKKINLNEKAQAQRGGARG